MGVQPAARAFKLCRGSVPPALAFCPCGLCLTKNAAGLRAAVMSVEMLQVHVDVKLAASDGRGTSRKDSLMRITSNVVAHAPQNLKRGAAHKSVRTMEKLKAVWYNFVPAGMSLQSVQVGPHS
eukprot:3532675-Rhodomonas_salina.1